MTRAWGLLLAMLLAASHGWTSESPKSVVNAMAARVNDNDPMGLRVLVYHLARLHPNLATWRAARRILHREPAVGFDILYLWESRKPGADSRDPLDERISAASRLLSQKQFAPAFTEFQAIARVIKDDMDRGHSENSFLYQFVIHSMARSLYGSGRYADALAVYQWISPIYPRYRQVLFERMWAAFRAGQIDFANGAIASQYSSYFNFYLEPETYLVQIYIYKKLCRKSDLENTLNSARIFQTELREGRYGVSKWVRGEVDTRVLWNLAKQTVSSNAGGVSSDERKHERKRIVTLLAKRFKIAKVRYLEELEKVLAYSELAFSSTSAQLPAIQKLPAYNESLRSGLEIWPVGDAEDWLDEFGFHRFIGDSQCGSSRPSS